MNSRPCIAVVGASVRGVAFSLLRAGSDVVAADLFADVDLARVCPVTRITNYPDELANWLANTPCDGWLYTGALENHPDLIERMAKLRPLLGNRGNMLRQVRDPLLLQEVLRAAKLNYPETRPCEALHPGEDDWLHKTGQGGNGSGVSHFTGELPTSGFWQRRINGTPGSAIYVSGKLCSITRQLIGESWARAGEFQFCGTLAPWTIPLGALADLTELGQVLTTQFSLLGLFGVDFILDDDRVWIIEVNPRVTAAAEVVERVTGSNLLATHLVEFGIHAKQRETIRVPAAGKAVLYAKLPLAVSRQLSELLLAAAGEPNRPRLADIPNPGTQISLGEPILTVLADGSTLDNVESELRDRVAALESSLYRDSGGI
jgi:uncharacterized protein